MLHVALAADRADVPSAQDGARQVRGRPHRQLVGAGLIISGGSNLGLFAGRILWMISMIPTEELIIDTIKNVLLFKKFAILILRHKALPYRSLAWNLCWASASVSCISLSGRSSP